MNKRGSRTLRYALVYSAHNVVKNNDTFRKYDRARGSIFPHPYSGKISTFSSNGRLGVYYNVLARGRTGSEHFSASILNIPVCNLVTLQIRRRTACCCPIHISLVLSWKIRNLQKKFHRATQAHNNTTGPNSVNVRLDLFEQL